LRGNRQAPFEPAGSIALYAFVVAAMTGAGGDAWR
jgi:hypothetical protein